jgi:plastocyanin
MADYVEVKGVKVRVGDRVRWVSEGVVHGVDEKDTLSPFATEGINGIWWIDARHMASLEVLPPAIKVGDRVKVEGMDELYEVLSVFSSGGQDFICVPGKYLPAVFSVNNCTKAPA